MTSTIRSRVILVGFAAFAGTFGAPACSRDADPTPQLAGETITHSYTVRGEIRQLPHDENPFQDLQIRHPRIPDFKGADGEVYVNSDGSKGMKPMVMPFPVKEGVSLDGLKVGDKVEFTFETVWGSPDAKIAQSHHLTQIEQLPDETEISFDE